MEALVNDAEHTAQIFFYWPFNLLDLLLSNIYHPLQHRTRQRAILPASPEYRDISVLAGSVADP